MKVLEHLVLVTCVALPHAATIPGLYPTGVDNSGALLPGNTLDPHWTLVQSADTSAPGPRAYVVRDGYPIPPWLANGPDSKWIAPQASQSAGNQPGDYVYRLTFNLEGLEPITAILTARWSSDNAGVDVRLNGQPTGLTYDGDFGAFSPWFSLRNGFVEGLNTIEFVVNNAGDSVNPTGFRAELRGTADPIAPPGTPPTITRQPASLSAAFKQPALFSVGAYGSKPLFYQWRLGARPIAHATNAELVIPDVVLADRGDYDVVVHNAYGSATSQRATLEVSFPSPAHLTREPPGPSTRRAGIVFTEIHYHPAPSPDQRNLEFVELHNSNPFFEDLSGWRLTGECDFTFPPNSILAGGAYLVVAADPDALRTVCGITNVVGGFTGKLANEGGTLRLRKRSGAIVLEVPYGDRDPWPAAADGAGHSLVLARPSLGERDPRAWAASALRGGSPGTRDPILDDPLTAAVINELLLRSAPDRLGFLELHNPSPQPLDLGGCCLTDDPWVPKLRLPAGMMLGPGAFLTLTETQLGFALDPAGTAVFLLDPEERRVLDAIRSGPQRPGTAFGRFPDGDRALHPLRQPTPSAPNTRARRSNVVISEIMYHPLSGSDDDQYLELHNRGTEPIDLTGWRLADGIEFAFPSGSLIAAGDFLVVARQANRLRTRYAAVDPRRILGDFNGTLSARGERITLEEPVAYGVPSPEPPAVPSQVLFSVADEVSYQDGGGWGRWADGGGSSLELVDPRADPSFAPSWADSQESAKAPWTLVEATGVLTDPHPSLPAADQLQLFLLGPGEALVDDVEVRVAGRNCIVNSTFETGLSGWTFQGTQRRSEWEPGDGYNHTRSMRLVATERGDHVVNRAFTSISPSLAAGTTATIRARVRWLKGHPEILLRLRNGALEAYGRLTVPSDLGTPGAPNSRRQLNAGPAITDVTHHPALPLASQPIRITASLDDPDGIAQAKVLYRVDPATRLAALDLVDDGSGPDVTPGDGVFTAAIPAQPAGTLIAFRVEATDAHGAPATTRFPEDAPAHECLARVGDTHLPGAFGNYHLWITSATHAFWSSREPMSNEDVDATFVYGTNRVIYRVGAHFSGSSYTSPGYNSPTGTLCGYDLNFPSDDRFLGETHVTLDWPIRDATNQREQLMYWFLDQYGLPNMYRRYVHLFVNGLRRGTIYDDVQQPGSDSVAEWFPEDDRGHLYKTDCWNEFDHGGNRLDPCLLNTLEIFTLPGGAKNTARYRWNWRPRAIQDSANNFAPLFALVDAVNSTSDYLARVDAVVDIDHWMRTFAMNDLASFWDAFGNPNAKNTFLYKPERDGWKLMCWDFDVGLGVFNDPPDAALFDVGDPTIRRLYQTPAFVRLYWAALQEALNTFFSANAVSPLLDAKYAAFQADGIPLESPGAIKSWITQRRAYLQSQLGSVRADFAITTHSGGDFTSAEPTVTLSGTAPVSLHTITVNSIPYPLTWSTVTRWNLTLALEPGANLLTLLGLDRAGRPLAGATDSIRVSYAGTEVPLPTLVINEWMAANRAAVPDPADGAFDDWFELHNPGPLPVSLAGFWLSDDPATPALFQIPPGFYVPPHGHLRVWADGQPDQTRPGGDLHVSFRLSQGADQIVVSDASGRLVDHVTFQDQVTDRSEGRWPDGVPAPFYPMAPSTPAAPNRIAPEDAPEIHFLEVRADPVHGISLSWEALPGRTYRVRCCNRLDGGEWTDLSPDVLATSTTATLIDPFVGDDGQRYYQVALLGGPPTRSSP